MMRALIVIVVLNITFITAYNEVRKNVTTADLRELRKLLFVTRDYDRFARPIPKTHTFNVTIDYSLIHITNFDLKRQTLTAEGWLQFEWLDESLSWDTTPFKHIDLIRTPSEQIYLPDIMNYNDIDYGKQKVANTKALVYKNGRVLWVPPMTLEPLCRVNLKRWPYDEHICFIKFGSWTHDGYVLDVFPKNDGKKPQFLSDFYENTEFEVSFINATREVKFYDCCIEPYPSVIFYFRLQRRPTLYHYIISIPALMAIIGSLITFWFPIRSNIRFVLNSFSFLTLTLLLLYLGTHLGFSSLGVPIAVRFLSLSVLFVGLLQIWLTIAYNISLLKCEIPLWTAKVTKPLLQMYRNTEHESIQLTQSEQLQDTKKSGQPNAEDLTFIIDKIVFIIFAFAIVINSIA